MAQCVKRDDDIKALWGKGLEAKIANGMQCAEGGLEGENAIGMQCAMGLEGDHACGMQYGMGLKGNHAYGALLTARELNISSINDPLQWKWVSTTDIVSCKFLDVAEMIEVRSLRVKGVCNANNLSQGRFGVYFCVVLKNNLCMNGPLTLKLTRPDGSYEVNTHDLTTKEKNVWIPLKVGEFTNTRTCGQDVKFYMSGAEITTKKTGLTVVGAIIAPPVF